MMVIFTFSSIPSAELPSLGWFDMLVKKGGHILGYGILSMAYLRGLDMDKKNLWIAWLLSIIYSITDEIHQIFVPGRHASVWDIGFDAGGAAVALFLYINNKKNPIWRKNTR
jgi:VanZ family protein